MPRRRFQQALNELQQAALRLGGFAERQLRLALQVLKDRDVALAVTIQKADVRGNRAYAELEQAAVDLLALQGPTAGDLRLVLGTLFIASEFERIADHAADIAKLVAGMEDVEHLDMPEPLRELTEHAQQMLRKAMVTTERGDVEMARSLADDDNKVDELQEDVFRMLIDRPSTDPVEAQRMLYVALAAHHLERVADRTTNIGEQVVYTATGLREELNPLRTP